MATKSKKSIVLKISSIYLFFTVLILAFFWLFVSSSQITTITEKALLQSQAYAQSLYSHIKTIAPRKLLHQIDENQKLYHRVMSSINDLIKKEAIPAKRVAFVTSQGYGYEPSESKTAFDSKDIRLLYQALNLKGRKNLPFLTSPDIFDYKVKVIIPLDVTSSPQIFFFTELSLNSVKSELRSLLLLAIAMVSFLLIVQGLFAYILYRLLLRPVNRLATGADIVSAGQFDFLQLHINQQF